jgi:hypothetical protein
VILNKQYFTGGVGYLLQSETDTLSGPSNFVREFYNSFKPVDSPGKWDPQMKKSALYFADFFSSDSLRHKKALQSLAQIRFDSTDLPQLKKAIQSLSWKDKKYLDYKKNLIAKLGTIPSVSVARYLNEMYAAASDTVELQYTILESLLNQKTAFSFGVFRDIVANEPPVIDNSDSRNNGRFDLTRMVAIMDEVPDVQLTNSSDEFNEDEMDGRFMDELNDSLKLTAGIFKDLLPLINLHDYEKPVMELAALLVDSGLLASGDYELYLPKLLLEGKQSLKKQQIIEKNRSIEKASAETEDRDYDRIKKDRGNDQLDLYATLLLPFWNKHPGVPEFFNQLLRSQDKQLKYNTALLLVRKGKAIPDTLSRYFASSNEFRYQWYLDLKEVDKLSLFPSEYKTQESLAIGQLVSARLGIMPDSIVLLKKVPMQLFDHKGLVYFFRYKQRKDDAYWKLATVGLLSEDPSQYRVVAKEFREVRKLNFTSMGTEKLRDDKIQQDQINKELKRIQYAVKKNSERFYEDEDD